MSRSRQADRRRSGRRHGEPRPSRDEFDQGSGATTSKRFDSRRDASAERRSRRNPTSNRRPPLNSGDEQTATRRAATGPTRNREADRTLDRELDLVDGEPWNRSRRAARRAANAEAKAASSAPTGRRARGRTTRTTGPTTEGARGRNAGAKTSAPQRPDAPATKPRQGDQSAQKRSGAASNGRGTARTSAKRDERRRKPAARRQPAQQPPAKQDQAKQDQGKQNQGKQHPAKQHQALQITPNKRGRTTKRRSDSRFSVGHSKPRLWTMIFMIAGVLILVLVQVIKMQTSGGDVLRAEGENQWSRSRVLPATRGTIFDRDGQEMAVSIPAASVSIDPKRVENPDQVIQLLTEIVGIDEQKQLQLRDAMAAKDRSFVYVERQIPLDVGERLLKLVSNRGVAGIHVDWEDKRILPGGTTGQSVIGLTDIDGVGISGLELKYGGGDGGKSNGFVDELSGTPGRSTRAIAPDGSTVVGTEQVTQEPIPGRDLVLTIDRSVQYAVERALVEHVSKLGTKGGQVIVMNSKTGETIAMASVVRDPDSGEVEVTARNSAAVDAYEPGSVVKAITVAAALNERTVTPETTFTVPWRKQFADDWLRDAAPHPDAEMTVTDILVHSSNIGTIMIKEGMADVPEVARRIHWNYMREFGLGERTAIDFPGESPGILKDWDELWGSERATVAYGQGVSSTSIQLISAINVIANDGTYVVPSLVKGVIDESGNLQPAEPGATHEVVRPEVAQQMHTMMRSVVCSGTAKLAQHGIENYAVAGKTGTGYKAQANGTYFNADGDYAYYASFVGFFPLDDPQITMLVSIDEPPADSVERFGGTAAAPIFAELVPTVAQAMRIAPTPGSGSCDEPSVEK